MNKKPHILITNDDGVNARGIWHLWNSLKDHARLTVIAPAREQSAVGLGITIREPLHHQKVLWPGNIEVESISGTPADCIKMALSVLLDEKPDLIVSGINRGTNAGGNVLYSGTVAGAIEGTLKEVPSIAFSCYDYDEPHYEMAEKHVPSIVQHVLDHPPPQGTFLNVNFPSRKFDSFKGYRMTRQGRQFWEEDPDKREHPDAGQHYYWLGAKLSKFDEHEDSDITWLDQGYIAAVPVHIGDLTDHQHLVNRKNEFESLFTS